MYQTHVTTSADWKRRYQRLFRQTPKSKRRTSKQINDLKWRAKLSASIFPNLEYLFTQNF